MKNLKEQIQEQLGQMNEARNYPYRISFMINGKLIEATITLDDSKDADLMDTWIEEQIDNTIMHADGGPNDIEL